MRTVLSLLAALLVAAVASAQPAVILPEIKPAPMPAPVPGAAAKLTGDSLYVVRSNDPCVVTASALGFVKITQEAGPLRIRGRFVDGVGTETRTFTEKNLWIVEAATTGRCELLVIPVGTTAEKDVIRRTLDVEAGEGPRPPPGPGPDPGPKPPDPQPVTSFRVFLIYESADNLTPEQRGIIYGKVVEDWLNANCTNGNKGWRRRDKDAPGENDPSMAPLWAAIKPKITSTPCIAVEVNGKVDIIPLDATPAAQVETLKKYRGK